MALPIEQLINSLSPEKRAILAAKLQPEPEPIAIIGIGCRFPGGANSPDAFWQLLSAGQEAISEIPAERWDWRDYYDADPSAPDKMYTRWGGFLDDVAGFDNQFFGIAPGEARRMDPQQRLLLEVAWEALEHAGQPIERLARSQTGIYIGIMESGYNRLQIESQGAVACRNDPYFGIGSASSIASGRLSYTLDIQGPNVAIDTACSSSLVATHLACQALRNRECDLALAGGVSTVLLPDTLINFCKMNMLSSDGRCKTFDASADGFVMGEGCGMVALKRLSDALEHGDPIIALIRGSAVNEDGRSSSQTAPNGLAQQAVVRQALANARVAPHQVQYVEAHGSGTALGDPIEVEALGTVLSHGRAPEQPLLIGALKTNIGHLVAASGIGGLIKTALSLQHGLIPPTLNLRVPNPGIPWDAYPLQVPTHATPWPAGDRRIAGVSSFGWSGTNAHAILEAAPEPSESGPSRPYQLLLLSAKTETALDRLTANLGCYLDSRPELDLADVAHTLRVGRGALDFRRAVVCRDRAEAITLLRGADPGRPLTSLRNQSRHAVAFLCPGVGDHYTGMARDLYQHEPVFRATVDHCCRLLQPHLGRDLQALLYPEQSATGTTPALNFAALLGRSGNTASDALHETALAQPAVFVIEYALAHLLQSWGIEPQALLGYSVGEYVAACVSGVLSLEDALRLVATRARLIAQLPAGSMLAVALSENAVQPYLSDGVCLAVVNGPSACVLAGPPAAIDAVAARLQAQEIACRPVPTTHAFHSTMLAPVANELTALVRSVTLNPPRIPYLSNVTGTWITAEQATDPAYWARHMVETVRFADGLGALLAQPDLALLEVGPGQALGSFARQHPACTREQRALILPTLRGALETQHDQAVLLGTLGQLWRLDVPIDWSAFTAHETRRRVALPTYPFEHQRFWVEPQARTAAAESPLIESPADLAQLKRNAHGDWFYLPGWQQRPPQMPAALPALSHGRCWLVFNDECGVGDALTRWLRAHAQPVVTIRPGQRFTRLDDTSYCLDPSARSDYRSLLSDLKARGQTPQHVVYGWPISADLPAEQSMKPLLDRSFYGLLYLGQALSELDLDRCHLSIVSNHVQRVTGCERLIPAKATLIGPCRSIQFEHPAIRCRSIDLELPADDSDFADLLINLVGELTAGSSEMVVALRDHRRWVQTVERMPVSPAEAPAFRQGGVYLITGGLGGIGLALAEHLARTYGAKLALIGRTALPPRHEWPALLQHGTADEQLRRRIAAVQELERLGGEVLLLPADVASPGQINQAVQQTLATFGALHGVIHAAGIPGQGLAALKTAEMVERVFAPKLQGTLALADALRGLTLDFLVLFSSTVATTGGSAGQIDYGAANAFLDSFAQTHFRSHGFTTAIAWGEWQWNGWDDAMNGYDRATQEFFRERRRKYGLTFAEGIEALERALARRLPNLLVSADDLHGLIQFGERASLAAFASAAPPSQPSYTRPNLATSYVAPRSELERIIAEVWSEQLGISGIGVNDNFFDLGGTSLVGMVLLAKLRKRLKLDQLPSYLLFEVPSIGAMAHYFEHQSTSEGVLDARQERGLRRRERQTQRRQYA